ELQDKPDVEMTIFGVMDLHGITTPYEQVGYHKNIINVAIDYLAAGVDPKKSLLIRQSKVPQHAELSWLFSTITPLGWLERLPTYKEKKEQATGHWQNNAGILTYPVLMAADVLIYRADAVPVGDDQKQHIDLMNEIGKKFNSMFGETFPRVTHLKSRGERILSLQNPENKMSKTGDDGISLTDSPDIIAKKIKRAVTDSDTKIYYDPKTKPAISNLLTIYHLLADKSIDTLVDEYENKSYADLKNDLAEVVINFLKPYQERRRELENNIDEVHDILHKSEEKARELAFATLRHVHEKMGLD
ncbi:MAG: tryptophan--tRNA ligase, partial [Nitrosarchaeum sp.]|nr:tryptophan--tRNA ligase [Nitrosarchaeum sp.]